MRRLFYILFLMMFCHGFQAQSDSSIVLDEKQWKSNTEQVDYTEDYNTFEKKKKKAEQDTSSGKVSSNDSNFDLSDYKYIFYALVLGLIAFLVYRVIKGFMANPDVQAPAIRYDAIETIEEKMHELDLQGLLNEALAQKNFRIALRIRFLILIKYLNDKGEIHWTKEKTNWDYVRETKTRLTADAFKHAVIHFEKVWYGEYPLDEMEYHSSEALYSPLLKQEQSA